MSTQLEVALVTLTNTLALAIFVFAACYAVRTFFGDSR